MSFPRYPAYKPSGVEWLGEVPEHWDVLPCRGIVDERNEKNEGAACQDYLSLMANVGIIPYEEKGDVGNKKPEDLGKCKLVRKGDFVINSMNYGIGSYGVSGHDGVCSPVYIVLIPKEEEVKPGFAFRIFEDKTFQSHAQSFGNGILAHRCAIGWDILKGIGVPVPSSHEQERILQFLDHETAKIDALIAEQQRLIELLQEKRQAVISHAVTKGLNPDAPMKDSGVEWLGEVPEHWGRAKIKHYFRTTSGSTPNSEETELYYTAEDDVDAIPWIRTTDINDREVERAEIFITPRALQDTACKLLPAGTVLVALYGGSGTVGKNGILKIRATVNQALCAILPSSKALPGYVHRYIQFLRPFWMERAVSARKAGNISQELVGDTPFPLPPVGEQAQIINHLDRCFSSIDSLIDESTQSLILLQERRSALISSAVTGQIDVRGLVSEAEAA